MAQGSLQLWDNPPLGLLVHKETSVKGFEIEGRFGRGSNKGVSGITLEIHSTLSPGLGKT